MADRPTVTLTIDDNGHVIINNAAIGSEAVPARIVMLSGRWGIALPADWNVPTGALEVLTALVGDISGWF